jgi:hypothetical protein
VAFMVGALMENRAPLWNVSHFAVKTMPLLHQYQRT